VIFTKDNMDPIITEIIDGETWEQALSRSVITISAMGVLSKMGLYYPGLDIPAESIQFLG